MKVTTLVLSCLALLAAASAVRADWDPGDPYKWLQAPDPTGWDVRNTYYIGVADDFMCTGSGPITDIHVWTSWKGDIVGDIEFVHTAIYADVPAGEGTFSHPADPWLWHRDWLPGEFIIRDYGTGEEGWYDPSVGTYKKVPPDHFSFDQLNFFIAPATAFQQVQGTVYWLEVSIKLTLASYEDGDRVGWKTSLDHWNDDAVWAEIVSGQPRVWHEITDPVTGDSLDMAFVITPEPGTLSLMVLGGLALLRMRKRK